MIVSVWNFDCGDVYDANGKLVSKVVLANLDTGWCLIGRKEIKRNKRVMSLIRFPAPMRFVNKKAPWRK